MTDKKSRATPGTAKKIYEELLDVHGEDKTLDAQLEAHRGTRTKLHEILQAERGVPQNLDEGKKLWDEVDELVESSGINHPSEENFELPSARAARTAVPARKGSIKGKATLNN